MDGAQPDAPGEPPWRCSVEVPVADAARPAITVGLDVSIDDAGQVPAGFGAVAILDAGDAIIVFGTYGVHRLTTSGVASGSAPYPTDPNGDAPRAYGAHVAGRPAKWNAQVVDSEARPTAPWRPGPPG